MNTEQKNLLATLGAIPEFVALEKALRHFEAANLARIAQLPPDGVREMMEINEEGLENFKAAGNGCAPLQCLLLGISYTVWAIEECRRKGPTA